MPAPDPKWGYAEWINYFRRDLMPSVRNDIRPLIATQGSFGAPRQFFPYIEYLSGLVFGPAGGHNLANTTHATHFLQQYMNQIDPLYGKHADILLKMWRHGLIHRYQPKVLKSSTSHRQIGWLSYFGTRTSSREEHPPGNWIVVSHLTPWIDPANKLDFFPVCVPELVNDLEKVIEMIATKLVAEQATGTSGPLLANMQAAANFLSIPETDSLTW
jgi:hypothetical protein